MVLSCTVFSRCTSSWLLTIGLPHVGVHIMSSYSSSDTFLMKEQTHTRPPIDAGMEMKDAASAGLGALMYIPTLIRYCELLNMCHRLHSPCQGREEGVEERVKEQIGLARCLGPSTGECSPPRRLQ